MPTQPVTQLHQHLAAAGLGLVEQLVVKRGEEAGGELSAGRSLAGERTATGRVNQFVTFRHQQQGRLRQAGRIGDAGGAFAKDEMRQSRRDPRMTQRIGLVAVDHLRIMRQLVRVQTIAQLESGNDTTQHVCQPNQTRRRPAAQRRRRQHQRRRRDAAVENGTRCDQAAHAVAEHKRGVREAISVVVVDRRQIFQQVISMPQRAARPGRVAVAALIVAAHVVTALVEPLRQPFIAAAVLAQSVHDQHCATRTRREPVPQVQALAVRHAQP